MQSTTVLRRLPRQFVCARYFSVPAGPPEPRSSLPARTRFAPSPTGFLHLGSLRTALFNYLLAKSTGGQFLLRIEDTDQKRTIDGAEENILETLRWAGLHWDEGPQVGGQYGPYRQSERTELHKNHVDILLKKRHAYRCFCTPERLKALALFRTFSTEYDRRCTSISESESEERAAEGVKHVVRLKAPDAYPSYKDLVYGDIFAGDNTRAHSSGSFEDPILLKSDGMPTYHLANVVDDHFMHITHVVRATEWMPSTPKHVHLYDCFGWKPPNFVHVGLLQDVGRKKLSKRNCDVMVNDYREKGYLPEALNNFVALLGWSHAGMGRIDVLSMEELIKMFSVDGLTSGNTIVNFSKLNFLQKHHCRIRIEDGGEGAKEMLNQLEATVPKIIGNTLETGEPITTDYISRILLTNSHNYINPEVFITESSYLFISPDLSAEPALKLLTKLKNFFSESSVTLEDMYFPLLRDLDTVDEEKWKVEEIQKIIDNHKEMQEWKRLMMILRLGLAGGMHGPTVAQTMWLLGKERSLKRLERVKEEFVEKEVKTLEGVDPDSISGAA